MISIDVPGSGLIELEHFVTDYSGALSEDGELIKEKDTQKTHILLLNF